jgi:hypothetical protein
LSLVPSIPSSRAKTEDERHDVWLEGLTENERAVLEQAEGAGILRAFEEAMRSSENQGTAQAKRLWVDKLFLSWLRTSVRKSVLKQVLDFFAGEFSGSLTFFGANEAIACIADGKVRAFVPYRLVVPRALRSGPNRTRVATIPPDLDAFREWTKLRQGYVAGRGCYFSEMVTRSRGDFARPKVKAWPTPAAGRK